MSMENKIYRAKNNVLIENLDDTTILLYLEETKNTHVLNEVGSYLWGNLANNTVNALAQKLFIQLEQDSDVAFESVLKDVNEFIDMLLELNLIEEGGE